MGGVLVVGNVESDCAATVDALRARGVDAVAAISLVDVETKAHDKEVILADLDTAIDLGWVRKKPGGSDPPRPLIVSSRHEAFLDVVRDRVAECLRAPFAIDDAISAIQRVLDHTPAPVVAPNESPLDAPDRDEAVQRFLTDVNDPEMLGVASLVARGTGSDWAVIAVLDSKRQTFVGHAGLEQDLLLEGGTARDWSFCTHTIAGGERLVVSNAADHPLFAGNPLVESRLIGAYAGVPITVDGFGVVGTVCALSRRPRKFDASDFAVLDLAARVAGAQLARRQSEAAPPPAEAAAAQVTDVRVGELVAGKYWVTAKLAGGGESDVFLARDRVVERMVVIKWIARTGDEPLLIEGRALSAVRHPNIVQLYDWGRTATGRSYLVLEHVEGQSIAETLHTARARGEPVPLPTVAATIRALAGSLESMHAAGYAHGDVKPANVILDRRLDRPVLIDFGFAIALEGPAGDAAVHGGTPGFSAPQQFMARSANERIDARVDVYALAALAYAMLASEGPFSDVTSKERIAAQICERIEPVSQRRPDVSLAVDAVLLRALSVDPAQRHATVLDFAAALEAALADRTHLGPDSPPPSFRRREPRSRGVAVRAFRSAAKRIFGEGADREAVSTLTAEARAVLDADLADDDYVPSAPLVHYLRAVSRGDRSRIQALARAVSSIVLPSAFAALGVTRTPKTVLHVAETLLHRFHDWGRVDLEWGAAGSARVKLTLPAGFVPELCTYLAEVLRVLLQTTGLASTVDETACAAHGGNACEFAIAWATT